MDVRDRLRDLSEFTLDPAAIARLGHGFCRRKHVVILGSIGEDDDAPVDVGMVHPEDQALIDILRAHLGRPIHAHRLTQEAVEQALQTGAPANVDMPELRWGDAEVGSETPTGRAVLDLLQRALLARASAVHISATHATVRVRIDGRLVAFPSALRPDNAHAFVAHLLDRANLSAPNAAGPRRIEGQFVPPGEQSARAVGFRISVASGEKGPYVTVTLEDRQLPALALDALGMSRIQQQACLSALERPGVVLLGGARGAGRTTTLYALLEAAASPHRACALVETHPARALGGTGEDACERFAAPQGLHTVDPAQLRNAEWDRLAFDIEPAPEAQGLGLPLWSDEPSGRSTLAVVRSFGLAPLLRQLAARSVHTEALAQSLRAVVHQRLLRRVCRACAGPAPASPQAEAVHAAWGRPLPHLRSTGCEACSGQGYVGRVGIFEVSLWPGRQTRPRTTHAALWAAGLARVETQDTTLDELWDVLGPPPQSLPHVSHAP